MNNLLFEKIMLNIDQLFFKTLKTIIDQIMLKYPRVPLEWMDIYYSFLKITPALIFNFNPKLGLKFKTYIGIQCKFFTRTYVKHFITNKYKILNESFSLNPEFINFDLNDAHYFNDEMFDFEIDRTAFTAKEFMIFNKRFLENKNCRQIEQETTLKYHQISKISQSIKSKIKNQFKNAKNSFNKL